MLEGAVPEWPLVAFRPLGSTVDLPVLSADVERSLSSDIQLLYQCAKCVAAGDDIAVATSSTASSSAWRWYTAQSRHMRVHMSQPTRAWTIG